MLPWFARLLVGARAPDQEILRGLDGGLYLRRWYLVRRSKAKWFPFNAYLHQFMQSDDERALHDHPWWNCSILLRGSYVEHLPGGKWKLRKAGSIVFRGAEKAHRVELLTESVATAGADPVTREIPVWTLFLTGKHVRQWGFLCPKGWLHWINFETQNGCGE